MELKDVIEKYGYLYIGDTSRIPLVSLKMRTDNCECPFLENNRCTIHLGKPSACALFPLGRCAVRENNGSTKIMYIMQPVECGTKDEQHTLREWMTEFDLEESETWFSVWQEAVFEISGWIKKRIDKIPSGKLTITYSLMVNILYLPYDLDKPLTAQFESNKDYIMLMLDVLEQTLTKEN
jgi:Fe-S-cluster containining protein